MEDKHKDYAKNYPQVLHDSPLIGPITVGNVNKISKDGKDRIIVNLNLRTAKSGDKNAVISFPADWNKAGKFQRGDQVNARIEGGYVKNIWPAKVEQISTKKVSAATVDQQVSEQLDLKGAEEAMDDAIKNLEKTESLKQEPEGASVGGGIDDVGF